MKVPAPPAVASFRRLRSPLAEPPSKKLVASGGRGRAVSLVTIRRVAQKDWRTVRELRLRALATDPLSFGSTHAEAAGYEGAYWRSWCRALSSGERRAMLLATIGKRAVGMARTERDPERPHVFGLYSLWVDPEARGLGVGRMLLGEAEAWIEARGGSLVELFVADGASAARRLYEQTGYQLDGRREGSPHAGIFEIGLSKTLERPGSGEPATGEG